MTDDNWDPTAYMLNNSLRAFQLMRLVIEDDREALEAALAAIPVTDIAGVLRFAAEVAVNEMKDARGAAEAVRHLQSMSEPT